MYGLVNKAIEQMVCTHYGVEPWMAFKEQASVDMDSFLAMHQYPDDHDSFQIDIQTATT